MELRRGDAQRDAVLSSLPGRAYLCFFCHGQHRQGDPQASGLLLAPAPGSGAKHNLLTLRDVQRAGRLSASRLAILAACESGVFDVVRMPDEYQGLAVGMHAEEGGVPGVLASLYPVEVGATDRLVREFLWWHRGRPRLAPAAALRQAQLALLRPWHVGGWDEGEAKAMAAERVLLDLPGRPVDDEPPSNSPRRSWADPYYWAGWQLIGA